MSTKTSIKRIAAVAAVALTLGGFSAVSAHAAFTAGNLDVSVDSANIYTSTQTTGAGIAGANNFVQLTQTASAGNAYHVVATGGTLVSSNAGVTGSGTASVVVADGVTANILVPTPTVGTITVKNYPITLGVESTTATSTVTITVAAAAAGTVYSSTSVTTAAAGTGLNSTGTITSTDVDGVESYVAPKGTAGSPALRLAITVTQKDASGIALSASATKAMTASVSGPGTLGQVGTPAAPYLAFAAGAPNAQVVQLFSDGRAGVSSVTISVGGVAVKTVTLTFYGAVASYSIATNASYVGVSKTNVSALTVTAKDSNGVAVPNATFYVKSSDSTLATVVGTLSSTSTVVTSASRVLLGVAPAAPMGTADLDITGVAKGVVTITAADAAAAADVTISATATNNVTGAQAASVDVALDAASYSVGQLMVLTYTLKDSDGKPVGDGTYTLYDVAAPALASTNLITTAGTAFAGVTTVTTVSGVATKKMYAPVATGTVSFTGKLSATSADISSALRGTATSASASIGSQTADAAQAAVDAANEATDAANAATDAANNAMDSADAAQQAALDAGDKADAALAAVTDLATKVSAIASQIASLSALVKKIAAKVKA